MTDIAQPCILTDAESKALRESGDVVRYAAEHVDDLDPALALTISRAREAASQNAWTPDIAAKFWDAFHTLCIAIRPVSTECLATADEKVAMRLPDFWNRKEVTLSDRSSTRYSVGLILLSALVMLLQVYVWVCQFEPSSIDWKAAEMKKSFDKFSLLYHDQFLTAYDPRLDATAINSDPKLRKLTYALCADFSAMALDISQLQFEAGVVVAFPGVPSYLRPDPQFLGGIAPDSVRIFATTPEGGKAAGNSHDLNALARLETCEKDVRYVPGEYRRIMGAYNSADLSARYAHAVAVFISSLLVAYIMPVLLGMMGAIAYVLRQISEQARRTTFSKTSPVMHWTRVIMGALAGLVVGLFGDRIPTQRDLPPLAFAFLTGYGVEVLFSVFDEIISRFRSAGGSVSNAVQPRSSTAS